MSPLRLVIFDVDGTLVDSQNDIVAAMTAAFEGEGIALPTRAEMLGIVGLSLDVAVAQLAPNLSPQQVTKTVQGYKDSYMDLRAQAGAAQSSPLYPGVRDVLSALQAQPDVLLGVATGKSQRGLDKVLEAHDLRSYFVNLQVADHHPSKPHPAMLQAALSETGIEAHHAVMIGDTSFDMEMAAAAKISGIGVTWGYHPRARLGAATHLLEEIQALPPLLANLWGTS